jgi:hypothetical protein
MGRVSLRGRCGPLICATLRSSRRRRVRREPRRKLPSQQRSKATPHHRRDPVRFATCFVAMPFDSEFDDVFHYGIRPVVASHDMVCVRIDHDVFIGDVPARIHQQIDDANVIIADLTGAKPNVYYEVGYAQRADKPTILICSVRSQLEFNLQGARCLFYEHIVDLEHKLSRELDGLLQPAEG